MSLREGDSFGLEHRFPGVLPALPLVPGKSRSNIALWLSMFRHVGRVDRTISADTPLYAAFRDGDHRTHVSYNAGAAKRTVLFSDGAILADDPGVFGVLDCPEGGRCNPVPAGAAP